MKRWLIWRICSNHMPITPLFIIEVVLKSVRVIKLLPLFGCTDYRSIQVLFNAFLQQRHGTHKWWVVGVHGPVDSTPQVCSKLCLYRALCAHNIEERKSFIPSLKPAFAYGISATRCIFFCLLHCHIIYHCCALVKGLLAYMRLTSTFLEKIKSFDRTSSICDTWWEIRWPHFWKVH